MKASVRSSFFLAFGLFFFMIGCEVTAEKVELWKGTKNGPKKLAATVIDKEVPMDLRAKALVALVEIHNFELFRETFKKMEKGDSEKVVDVVIPILSNMVVQGENGEKTISKIQVDAKDALYILLDYASPSGQAAAQKALIEWSVADYNTRAMAGQYNIRTIVKRMGAPAASALVRLLKIDQVVIKYVAELIREVNDPAVLEKASKQLASELKQNVEKIQESHLLAAAIIGGEPVGSALMGLATNSKLSEELQRFSLRAFSEGLNTGTLAATDDQIAALFVMAENTDFDQYQREETYYVIAQAARPADLPKFFKLLNANSSFWRAVGLRCILRMDGEGSLEKSLEKLESSVSKGDRDEIEGIVSRVKSFPKLLPIVKKLLGNSSSFVVGVAVVVLADLAAIDDIKSLEKLLDDNRDLPKGFEYRTLKEAAKFAVSRIKERG